METIQAVIDYLVDNLPALGIAVYAFIQSFNANKKAAAANGNTKLQVKCRNVTTKDFAAMIEYHKKEADFLQGLYDKLYEEEESKNA